MTYMISFSATWTQTAKPYSNVALEGQYIEHGISAYALEESVISYFDCVT